MTRRFAAAALAFCMLACGRSDLGLEIAGADGAVDDSSGPLGLDGSSGEGRTADAPTSSSDGSAATDGSSSDGAKSGDSAASDGAPTCANCSGCCDGTTCIDLPQTSPSQCGFLGQACAACKTGGMCLKGACVYPTPHCGPANCQGCCWDANDCSDGTAQDACGFGGELCRGCGPIEGEQACVPQPGGGGSCWSGCGPGTCGGCCNGATCEVGQSASACGQNGAPCAACGPGEICSVQGVGGLCQEPCSPSTCMGCCQGEVCAVGDQGIACGTGGAACADCNAQNYFCVQGTCQP
jgi:hypothetical protein